MAKNNDMLYRELTIEDAADAESRTVQISFSSEQRVCRYDWLRGEYYDEILGHEPGNVDLSRLQSMGVALFNHDRDRVIGAVMEPELDAAGHRCRAKIRFDSDEFSEMIFQKVLSGTLKGISVGYSVSAWEQVAPGAVSTCGRFAGPCRVARSWTPYEVSSVSIPADPDVGVERSLAGISEEELQEFRAYKKQRRELQRAGVLANLQKELEIMEMEG